MQPAMADEEDGDEVYQEEEDEEFQCLDVFEDNTDVDENENDDIEPNGTEAAGSREGRQEAPNIVPKEFTNHFR